MDVGAAGPDASQALAFDAALLAAIDIGTVTVRLAVARADAAGLTILERASTICNLGEGVDETGRVSAAAQERVVKCCAGWRERLRALLAEQGLASMSCCMTLTSAARDAENGDELLDALRELGFAPQIISGELEGQLTFLGVAQDFPGRRLCVCDSGGGSTEFACGSLGEDGLTIDFVRSVDVGARRLTERFLSESDPPALDQVEAARAYAATSFAEALQDGAGEAGQVALPELLVATGGTATSLVAMVAELEPYDSAFVHLHALSRKEVEGQVERLLKMTQLERANIAGLQPQRAPVILGGALAVEQALAATGFDELVVSESDLLLGLVLAHAAALGKTSLPISWFPTLSTLDLR